MIPDPRNPASQAYMTQQYVQQTPTTPQQIYYQEGPKDSNALRNLFEASTPLTLSPIPEY